MIAHKCDRCGKLYETYHTKENQFEINSIETMNRDFTHNRRFTHGPYDLCPDCSKELVDWLYKFKKESEQDLMEYEEGLLDDDDLM